MVGRSPGLVGVIVGSNSEGVIDSLELELELLPSGGALESGVAIVGSAATLFGACRRLEGKDLETVILFTLLPLVDSEACQASRACCCWRHDSNTRR